jgi:hypothetical protein
MHRDIVTAQRSRVLDDVFSTNVVTHAGKARGNPSGCLQGASMNGDGASVLPVSRLPLLQEPIRLFRRAHQIETGVHEGRIGLLVDHDVVQNTYCIVAPTVELLPDQGMDQPFFEQFRLQRKQHRHHQQRRDQHHHQQWRPYPHEIGKTVIARSQHQRVDR